MKINLISYESVDAWILGKFAKKIQSFLKEEGHEINIGDKVDPKADINHHISYRNYDPNIGSDLDTLMITHVDTMDKLKLLKQQLTNAKMGICMSKDTMNKLISIGIPQAMVCFINPAHDGVFKPKKIRLGLTTRLYPDGRKRSHFIKKLIPFINNDLIEFYIMGSGWEKIIEELRAQNINVIYHDDFNYDNYVKDLPCLDYYLYLGEDEGSMGFVDALASGVKTVVVPQGYHLDVKDGIDHGFQSFTEFKDEILNIQQTYQGRIDSVGEWTWKNYALKHLQLWENLLGKEVSSFGIQNEALNKYELVEISSFQTRLRIFMGSLKYLKNPKDFLKMIIPARIKNRIKAFVQR